MTNETYNPDSRDSRQALASALLSMLERLGAKERPNIPSTQERQIARKLRVGDKFSDVLQVCVYTTIVGNEVRDVGKDAIRVALLYKCRDGRIIGVGSDTRVNRVGKIGDICARVIDRWNNVEANVSKLSQCQKCAAPMIASKNKPGKFYCAEKCWLTEQKS